MTPDQIATVEATLRAVRKHLKAERQAARRRSDIPSANIILARALDETGHADAWQAETLSDRQHLDVLHAVRLEARRWLRAEAAAVLVELAGHTEKALFGAAKAAVGRFFERAGQFIREAVVAGVLAVAGPDPAVLGDPVIQEAIERQVDAQAAYLEVFRREILDEAKPADGTFVARAEQYGSAVWPASQTAIVDAVLAGGIFHECRRVHTGADSPCEVCDREQARGWIAVEDLVPIGLSPCRCHCHCHVEFREGEGATEYVVGPRLIAAARGSAPSPNSPKGRRRVAGAIRRATRIAESHGVRIMAPVEAAGFLDMMYGGEPHERKATIAIYDDFSDAIALNDTHPAWSDMRGFVRTSHANRYLSTPAHDHVIRTEIGHALHYRNLANQGRTAIWNTWLTAEEELLAGRVSRYAAENRKEFVAEVFAMKWAGAAVDSEVEALYDALGGPSLP